MIIRDDQIYYDVLRLSLSRLNVDDEKINYIMTSDLDVVNSLTGLLNNNSFSRKNFILDKFLELKKNNKEDNIEFYFELYDNLDLRKAVENAKSSLKYDYEDYVMNICTKMNNDDIGTFCEFVDNKNTHFYYFDEEKKVVRYMYNGKIFLIENSLDIIDKLVNLDSKKLNDFVCYYSKLLERYNLFDYKYCNLFFEVLCDTDFYDFITKTIDCLSYDEIKQTVLLDKKDDTNVRKNILIAAHENESINEICKKLKEIDSDKLEKSFDKDIYSSYQALNYLELIKNSNGDQFDNLLDYMNKKTVKSKDKKIKKLLKNVK